MDFPSIPWNLKQIKHKNKRIQFNNNNKITHNINEWDRKHPKWTKTDWIQRFAFGFRLKSRAEKRPSGLILISRQWMLCNYDCFIILNICRYLLMNRVFSFIINSYFSISLFLRINMWMEIQTFPFGSISWLILTCFSIQTTIKNEYQN